jgi:hypothetical protein
VETQQAIINISSKENKSHQTMGSEQKLEKFDIASARVQRKCLESKNKTHARKRCLTHKKFLSVRWNQNIWSRAALEIHESLFQCKTPYAGSHGSARKR